MYHLSYSTEHKKKLKAGGMIHVIHTDTSALSERHQGTK